MKNATPAHLRLPERSKAKALYEKQLPAHKAALQQLAQVAEEQPAVSAEAGDGGGIEHAEAVADVEHAAELAPDDPLFAASAEYLQVPISLGPPAEASSFEPLPPEVCYDLGLAIRLEKDQDGSLLGSFVLIYRQGNALMLMFCLFRLC